MGVSDMGVDLSGGNIGVSEHRLDSTEIGSVHQ